VKSIVALLAIFALADPGIANAASSEGADTYIGLGFGNSDVSVDGISDLDLDVTLLQVGVWVSDEISLEIRTGRGSNDDTVQGVDYEIEALYGLYRSSVSSSCATWIPMRLKLMSSLSVFNTLSIDPGHYPLM